MSIMFQPQPDIAFLLGEEILLLAVKHLLYFICGQEIAGTVFINSLERFIAVKLGPIGIRLDLEFKL